MIQWNGQQVLDEIAMRIDASAHDIGSRVVTEAKINASGWPGPTPRTGRLRREISYAYDNVTHTISFIVGAPYALFVEMGTRHSRAYPFLRPAINAAETIYGFQTEMSFQNVIQTDKELLFGGGRYVGGKGLTAGQKRHVKWELKPKAEMHHVGNVSRAALKVRHKF